MKYCPKCQAVFRPAFICCTTCDVALLPCAPAVALMGELAKLQDIPVLPFFEGRMEFTAPGYDAEVLSAAVDLAERVELTGLDDAAAFRYLLATLVKAVAAKRRAEIPDLELAGEGRGFR